MGRTGQATGSSQPSLENDCTKAQGFSFVNWFSKNWVFLLKILFQKPMEFSLKKTFLNHRFFLRKNEFIKMWDFSSWKWLSKKPWEFSLIKNFFKTHGIFTLAIFFYDIPRASHRLEKKFPNSWNLNHPLKIKTKVYFCP